VTEAAAASSEAVECAATLLPDEMAANELFQGAGRENGARSGKWRWGHARISVMSPSSV